MIVYYFSFAYFLTYFFGNYNIKIKKCQFKYADVLRSFSKNAVQKKKKDGF